VNVDVDCSVETLETEAELSDVSIASLVKRFEIRHTDADSKLKMAYATLLGGAYTSSHVGIIECESRTYAVCIDYRINVLA